MYLPRKVVKGRHYAEYKPGVKTKAAVLKEALKIAIKEGKHAFWIDFIPSVFTLQVHGWFDPGAFKNIADIKRKAIALADRKKDVAREFEKKGWGKWHYDLRVQKKTAPTWFGVTPLSAPYLGTPENKVMTSVKGYQAIAPGGKALQKFLKEKAEAAMAARGVAERRDRLEWLKVKAQWFPVNSPGNPQKNQEAAMVALDFYEPACLHRRSFDFIDVTFFGKYLSGRYYIRLVERKLSEDELTEWQKEKIKEGKTKAFWGIAFYLWKAKQQWGSPGSKYSEEQVRKAALGKITLDRIPAPPPKGVSKKELEAYLGLDKLDKPDKKVEAPLATKEFH